MIKNHKRILELARKTTIIRPRDVAALGIPREYVGRLASSGQLARIGWGLYVLREAEVTAVRVGGSPSAQGISKLHALMEDPTSGVVQGKAVGLRYAAVMAEGAVKYWRDLEAEFARDVGAV